MTLFSRLLAAMVAGLLTACAPSDSAGRDSRSVLLFAGEGTSAADVEAWKQILVTNRLRFEPRSSAELNQMSAEDFREFQLIIIPGGNFESIGNGLTGRTSIAIRQAVWSGTNYLGICAGAFFAGNSPYNGLDLLGGRHFGFHTLVKEGVRKAPVQIRLPGGEMQHYWEDGPELSGWGGVAARYPDGTPAVVQGSVGHGWVVLVGTHPEAPESWRGGMEFHAPARVSQEFASKVLVAAFEGRTLPEFDDIQ